MSRTSVQDQVSETVAVSPLVAVGPVATVTSAPSAEVSEKSSNVAVAQSEGQVTNSGWGDVFKSREHFLDMHVC